MSIANVYHHRRVADSAAKACYICYKPTSSVLNQADGKDWFYICSGHLSDRGFAQPIVNKDEEEAKKKKEELDREIAKVKQEYEEKQKKKKKNSKKKDDKEDKSSKEKEKEKDKDKDKDKDEDKDTDEKERDEKIKSIEEKAKSESSSSVGDGPRIFALQKNIYQMRITRIKNAQQAKQMQERLKNPATFPSVPMGEP